MSQNDLKCNVLHCSAISRRMLEPCESNWVSPQEEPEQSQILVQRGCASSDNAHIPLGKSRCHYFGNLL